MRYPVLVFLMLASLWRVAGAADAAVDPAVLARISASAMKTNWAYQRLTDLTDQIGGRLSGSPQAGVPGFEPLVDARNYFDYHHTAADTLDKVDPDNLRRQVAVLSVLVYFLANAPQAIDRMPVKQ